MRTVPLFSMLTLIGLSGVLVATPPAEALQFAKESATGKSATIIPLRIGGQIAGPVGLELGLRIIPGLNDLLDKPGTSSGGLAWSNSVLFDADLMALYKFQLADINFLGRFNPSISPFLGYRYLGVPSAQANASLESVGGAFNYNQFGGLNYGVRADTELPLGFSAFTSLGLTTLLSGGWDTRGLDSKVIGGKTQVGGATLPSLAIGARWGFLNAFELSIGYSMFTLPTALRAQAANLSPERTTINSLDLGLRFLSFSI